MNSYFIAHGSPSIIMENSNYVQVLKNLKNNIPEPKAIVIFSAHYESKIQKIGTANSYSTIYDFYGFPNELYSIETNYFSNLEIAKKIQLLLKNKNIPSEFDSKRGIDHGSWTILKLLFPKLNIPVITMSVNPYLTNEEQYNIGIALEPLKNDNILIIGSGGIIHNLSLIDFYSTSIDEWATKFHKWIITNIQEWNLNNIFNYKLIGKEAKLSVPRNEHFIPLLIIMGTANSTQKCNLLINEFQYGNLSLDLIEF